MDALVMCGGKGTRLETPIEKPLYPICDVPMVEYVCDALAESRLEQVYAVVSPQTPETAAHLERRADVTVIETAGAGYVPDLVAALERPMVSTPICSVATDLPAISPASINRILDAHGTAASSCTVCVPVALKRRLGVSVDTRLEAERRLSHLAPTGCNVVGDPDAGRLIHRTYDPRLALNVNRPEDAASTTAYLEATDATGPACKTNTE